MKIRMKEAAAGVVATILFSTAQAAPLYEFSYRFTDGLTFSGSFSGTENGELVWIEGDIALYANGQRLLDKVTFSTKHFLIPELSWRQGGAVASFDGSANNFLFDFADSYGSQRWAFFSIPQGYAGETRWTYAGNFAPLSYSEFMPSANMNEKWVLIRREDGNEVPEPASIALFALGLVLACAGVRSKRHPTANKIPDLAKRNRR